MTISTLTPEATSTIRSLISQASQTKSILREAARSAAAEKVRQASIREAEEKRRSKLEARFEKTIGKIALGILHLSALAKTPEFRRLIKTRHEISKSTSFYYGRTQNAFEVESENRTTDVSIEFVKDFIEVEIRGQRPSPCQSVNSGAASEYNSCVVFRRFSVESLTEIDVQWLRYLFTSDLVLHWYSFEFEDEWLTEGDAFSKISCSSAGQLDYFSRFNVHVAASADGWRGRVLDPNLVLLRVFADCSDPKKLNQYLEAALKNLE
ncbi:MAG: hypothetical protein JWN64_398 [Parcubacteria group bacterium]|nr:hypothetical protein [Parcubacteria group bacterium]